MHHNVEVAAQPIACNVAQHVSLDVPSHHVLTAHLLECSRLQHSGGAAAKLLHLFIRAWTAIIVNFDGLALKVSPNFTRSLLRGIVT